jgi:phosphohistidine phosphatase
MGRLVRDEGLVPDRMLSSTARRARKTAEVVAEVCGYDGKIVMTPDFYPGDPSAYIRVLRSLPDEVQRVMVVGHNPGLEALLAVLTGERRPLATAALAQVELPIEKWQELNAQIATRGRLVNLWRPVEGK